MDREMEKLLRTADYDFLRTNEHLGDRICMLTLGGSRAYGTNTPESDVDIRGIALPTKREILLGKDFEQVVDKATDTVVYSINKMITLLSNCNPNTIEIAGLPRSEYFTLTKEGELLLDNIGIFLSVKAADSFGGYATQQLYRLQQKSLYAMSDEDYMGHIAKVMSQMKGNLLSKTGLDLDFDFDDKSVYVSGAFERFDMAKMYGILQEFHNTYGDYTKHSHRNENAMTHGKITKHSMHLIRLYMMGIDILEKGEINTRRTKEHDLLMSIRNGAYLDETGTPTKEFFDMVKDYEEKFNYAKKHTVLPPTPNTKEIEELRAAINESIVCGKEVEYDRETSEKEME